MWHHKPVLLQEVLHLLEPQPGEWIVDGTVGSGGHAEALAQAVGPEGKLIGIDQDPTSIERAIERLKYFPWVILRISNFIHLTKILSELNLNEVHAVLLDVGFSSDQMSESSRGFSFDQNGPLDMRLGPEAQFTAAEIVNEWPQEELEKIFWEYGEEAGSRRFAQSIVDARRKKTIVTTYDLVEVLAGPKAYWKPGKKVGGKRHFATRVFQALRIAVNQELENLRQGLQEAWTVLKPGGRLGVITFHSLEDRIVKYQFREWQTGRVGECINKKPIVPTREEQRMNRRSRSAKLRGIQKFV